MEKIYGYKEKDVVGLAEFLKERGNQSLTKVFQSYGEKFGKAKGPVRNLYYALAKRSQADEEFCNKYLGGKPLSVGKIIEFNDCEERALIKTVLKEKARGKSVRSAIMGITSGDAKTSLRYQNKYRNALKNKPELITEVIEELKSEGVIVQNPSKGDAKNFLSEENFNKLKGEINNLVAKIALKEKKDNEYLKEKILILEKENLRLRRALYGEGNFPAVNFFRRGGEQNIIN